MKIRMCLSMAVCVCVQSVFAGKAWWQQLTRPSVEEAAVRFRNPAAEYGLTLWWGWDGPVDEETIQKDLDTIRSFGFTGVMIEAGYGMTARYLSPEWFNLVRFAVGEAGKRNMRVWIEDEGKYPSGFAGGRFSEERPDLRMQALSVSERIDVEPGQAVSRGLAPDEVSAAAFNAADSTGLSLPVENGRIEWTAPEGKWQVILARHGFMTSPTRSVNNPTRGKDTNASLMDYLNPEAARQFLAWTHEGYKNAFKPEFGRTFMGFMGDEPDYSIRGIPWTGGIFDAFLKEKGYDVRPMTALFFAPKLSDPVRRAKADYWDVWSRLFAENFFRVQHEWCAQNGVSYIVHLNKDDDMPALARSGGDFFRNMKYAAAPGVDAIWSQIWMDHTADYPKYASSAAHTAGKPRAFTESFAAYTHRPTPRQAKWVMDYQLARGINMVQIMFYSSSAGRRPPPEAAGQSDSLKAQGVPGPGPSPPAPRERRNFFESPEFPRIADTMRRVSYMLSQGRPAAQTAMIVPTASVWCGDARANTNSVALARALMENQRDFDWVDEGALVSDVRIKGDRLVNRSGQEYKAVIVPDASVLFKSTVDRLREFAGRGGRVVIMGRGPVLAAGRTFLYAEPAADIPRSVRESAAELSRDVLEYLPPPDVQLDRNCPSLKIMHRKIKDADVYFCFNEDSIPSSCRASLAGRGTAQVWDGESGTIRPLYGVRVADGFASMPLDLGGWESVLVVIGPVPAQSNEGGKPALYLIGDSTVRNGRDDGQDQLWGWGRPLEAYFDTAQVRVENRALGGRSSRTFQTQGLWAAVRDSLKPGDFVMMQFGHNDDGPINTGRARGTLKGTGEEIEETVMDTTGKTETVHTYGWYMRRMIRETTAKGAAAIVLSPVPRDSWEEGKVKRIDKTYGLWAGETARSEGAFFIDLNELVARRYEKEGFDRVHEAYFTSKDHTHTSWAGAALNASMVVEGVHGLKGCSLAKAIQKSKIKNDSK